MLLYHYTSLQTFCKIVYGIRNHNLYLRAGDAAKMNDPNDCYYFIYILGSLLGKTDTKEMSKLIEDKMLYNKPYLVSLSNRGDDLHMWNCYGDDGKGIAISFDRKALQSAVDEFALKNHIYSKLLKCIYSSSRQIEKSLSVAKLFKDYLGNENVWKNLQSDNYPNLVKHPCYRYEKEYRIVINHGENEPTINNVYHEDEDAFYINIPLLALKKVIVGPNADLESIKGVFSPYLPNVKFVQSQIPYRSK